eukprot:gb/GECH01003566.1/.p1 GENE.gb/GECH01003566.1/~~gb/GECH01003566.1/.p1  ORF type:complete len:119 (+),score=25.81 gb/GECH01003566.1/:1-357(+)
MDEILNQALQKADLEYKYYIKNGTDLGGVKQDKCSYFNVTFSQPNYKNPIPTIVVHAQIEMNPVSENLIEMRILFEDDTWSKCVQIHLNHEDNNYVDETTGISEKWIDFSLRNKKCII